MNTHRESWAAWIMCSLGALAMFAVFWFYLVFHRLLGLAARQLVSPFMVLTILVLCFAAATKTSREKLLNQGRIAPLAIAVWSFFLLLSLWIVYYARDFGYLNASFALVCYISFPISVGLLGLLTFSWMRRFVNQLARRHSDGADKSRA